MAFLTRMDTFHELLNAIVVFIWLESILLLMFDYMGFVMNFWLACIYACCRFVDFLEFHIIFLPCMMNSLHSS